MVKISQDADWFDRVRLRLPFSFQPYYANANQLKQAKVILVVSTQLGRERTPLRGSLNQTTYPFTITNFIIIIVFLITLLLISFLLSLILLRCELPIDFRRHCIFMAQITWPPQPTSNPLLFVPFPDFWLNWYLSKNHFKYLWQQKKQITTKSHFKANSKKLTSM